MTKETQGPPPDVIERFPSIPITDTDRIFAELGMHRVVQLVRHESAYDPMHLDVYASYVPGRPISKKEVESGVDREEVERPRLGLKSQFVLPLSRGSDEKLLAGKYRYDIIHDERIRSLITTKQPDNTENGLYLAHTDKPKVSVVTHVRRNSDAPYEFFVDNQYKIHGGTEVSRAPYLSDLAGLREQLTDYLQLVWIVSRALGDPEVPAASLIDKLHQGAQPWNRRRIMRPGRSEDHRTDTERSRQRRSAFAKLTNRYAPVVYETPLKLSAVRGLGATSLQEIEMRLKLLKEHELAREYGALALGGILVSSEPGNGKTALAKAIVADTDYQLHFKPSDLFVEGDTVATGDNLRGLAADINQASTKGDSWGVVIDGLEPLLPANTGITITEEVRGFVRKMVENPRVLLVGTMNALMHFEEDAKTAIMPLHKAGLSGLGYFDAHVHIAPTAADKRKFLMHLFSDDEAEGRRLFVPMNEKVIEALQNLTEDESLAKISNAFLIAKARKAHERLASGRPPGPITVEDIAEALHRKSVEVEADKRPDLRLAHNQGDDHDAFRHFDNAGPGDES